MAEITKKFPEYPVGSIFHHRIEVKLHKKCDSIHLQIAQQWMLMKCILELEEVRSMILTNKSWPCMRDNLRIKDTPS